MWTTHLFSLFSDPLKDGIEKPTRVSSMGQIKLYNFFTSDYYLGKGEYSFVVITPRLTKNRNGKTYQGPIIRSNLTNQFFIRERGVLTGLPRHGMVKPVRVPYMGQLKLFNLLLGLLFGERGVLLPCNYSQAHSDPEWKNQLGSHQWVK